VFIILTLVQDNLKVSGTEWNVQEEQDFVTGEAEELLLRLSG